MAYVLYQCQSPYVHFDIISPLRISARYRLLEASEILKSLRSMKGKLSLNYLIALPIDSLVVGSSSIIVTSCFKKA